MAITLNRFSTSMVTYIAAHNTNATTIELASAATATASGVTLGIRGYIANGNRIGNWALLHGVGCRG